ncbi:class 1b ribonucleoside-diphosphate reductase subunit beta [Mollicutes bacterium LVI A0078]|nr:class 1b ribonucleoside-diphosphate reductase subunit beta [Mollicutes bacterium LVI A0075]WOO90895.1 class 1b ribonucleoside-diphosphate reductase subunit beta [Mollicutes bacterium LVI A0078]
MKKAVNWNDLDDQLYKDFWDQNVRQFWVDEEIPVSEDKLLWESGEISATERDTYEKILAGLTLLDTVQGGDGMPNIAMKTENLHAKAVFTFQAMMEQMHAKSYSTIFSTLSTMSRIDELFDWVHENDFMQKKADIVDTYYQNIDSEEDYYLSLAASVMLETFLFYSGFFFPLYMAAQGKLIRSGEIINLIIRDEEVHGKFSGILAQKELAKFDDQTQRELKAKVVGLLESLYMLEISYTNELYDELGLVEEVLTYVKYNADRALENLGMEKYFNVDKDEVNPLVINGIDTNTKNHDFFSTKGNGYIKSTNIAAIDDDVFNV